MKHIKPKRKRIKIINATKVSSSNSSKHTLLQKARINEIPLPSKRKIKKYF